MQFELNVNTVKEFLYKVDKSFPVSLSQSINLDEYAKKLCQKSTMCVQFENDKIVSLVAGYTKNLTDNMAFISLVATLDEAKGKGCAQKLLNEFIGICQRKNIPAVHLYVYTGNTPAEKLYKKTGFVKSDVQDRPDKTHLIYYIKKRGE